MTTPARRIVLVLVATVAVGLAGTTTGCMPTGYSNPSTIPTAVYDTADCTASNATKCQNRLNQIRADGFDIVLNYAMQGASNADRSRYATYANNTNLKLVWPVESTPNTEIASYVQTVDPLPATVGYYLWDEPTGPNKNGNPGDWNEVMAKKLLMKNYSSKPCLIVTRPKWQDEYATMCEYVGPDDYPVGTPFNDPPVGQGAAAAGRTAAIHGTQHLIFVNQAFSWWGKCDGRWPGTPIFPTRDQMRQARTDAMTAAHSTGKNIDIMFWFSDYCMTLNEPGEPASFEADVAWAANGS